MPKADEKYDNPLPVHCGDCGRDWDIPLRLPMPLDDFAKVLKKSVCPSCGSKKVYLREDKH